MNTYIGEVISGLGHMSQRMQEGSIALALYEKETGLKLVPGSLNIKLQEEVDMPTYAHQIARNDHNGKATIYVTPALVNNLECFAVRSELTEEGKGRHPKSTIELISAYKLREKLDIEDGSIVTVCF